MTDWQPIETAPKDGTEVLLWRRDSGVFLGRWIAPEEFMNEVEMNQALLDGEEDRAESDWFYADFLYGGRVTDGTPTHWMPLPEPPKG